MTEPSVIIVIFVIAGMIISLYKEIIKPVLVFTLAVMIFMLAGILSTREALSGFANEQIGVIF